MNQKRGFGLFSLVISLAMIGLIFWLMNESLSKSLGGDNGEGVGQGLLAPIEAAKKAKDLVEKRSQIVP